MKYYKKSALSVHMFKDHPESFDNKLRNYELGIIKSASPLDLDRCEDYYLEDTKAHLSLNRYKVTQKWWALAFLSCFSILFFSQCWYWSILSIVESCITSCIEKFYLTGLLKILYLYFTDVFKWYLFTEELKRLHMIFSIGA